MIQQSLRRRGHWTSVDNATYFWRVRPGTPSAWSVLDREELQNRSDDVGRAAQSRIPTEYGLSQNTLTVQPFNYDTLRLAAKSHVTLSVFQHPRQQLAILVNADIDAGYHEIHSTRTILPARRELLSHSGGRFRGHEEAPNFEVTAVIDGGWRPFCERFLLKPEEIPAVCVFPRRSCSDESENRWSTMCRPKREPVYKKARCTTIRNVKSAQLLIVFRRLRILMLYRRYCPPLPRHDIGTSGMPEEKSVEPRVLRGFRDYLPAQMNARLHLISMTVPCTSGTDSSPLTLPHSNTG